MAPARRPAPGRGRLERDRAGQRLRPRAAGRRALARRRARALEGAGPRPGARARVRARLAEQVRANAAPGGPVEAVAGPCQRGRRPRRFARRLRADDAPSRRRGALLSSPATISTRCCPSSAAGCGRPPEREGRGRGGDRGGQRRAPPLLPRGQPPTTPAMPRRSRTSSTRDARPRGRARAAPQPRRRGRRRRRARGVQAGLRELRARLPRPTRSSAIPTPTVASAPRASRAGSSPPTGRRRVEPLGRRQPLAERAAPPRMAPPGAWT